MGLLRCKADGTSESWAQYQYTPLHCMGRMEEHAFEMEYDADSRTLQMYNKNMHTNKMEQIAKNIRDLEDRDGETTLLTNFDEVGRSGKQPVLRGGAVLGVGGDQGQSIR